MDTRDEYEVVAYPRLRHVRVDTVVIQARRLHIHREMELCLVRSGRAVIRANGTTFSVQPDSIFFFYSNQPHQIDALGPEGVQITYIQVANTFCSDYLSLFRNLELEQMDLTGFLSAEQNARLKEGILDVVSAYRLPGAQGELSCMTGLFCLFSRLLEWVPQRSVAEAEARAKYRRSARLRRVTAYVDTHATQRLTLGELAEAEGVTVTYLSHFIHDNLGMTFQDYVNQVRFERALKLMEHPEKSLTDICLECGFSDLKYLKRIFMKRFGCTPKAYRQKIREQES